MDKEIVKKMRQAIKNNNLMYIKSVIDNNNELVDYVTIWGTWLHDASRYGMYDVVKYLIEKGANVNVKGGNRNAGPLTNAAFKGHKDIIELLLENGAILDTSDFDVNPLFAAIYNGHIDVVKYLVENGIDLDASYDIGSLKDVDAYEYARQYGQTEIANYLKEQKENNQ
jgi:ankyrin repeat protein